MKSTGVFVERIDTESFECEDDEGVQYVVQTYYLITTHRGWDTSKTKRGPFFDLRGGTKVNQINSETFEIVDSDKRIRKIV